MNKQCELFPDHIKDKPHVKTNVEYISRGQSRGYTKKPAYKLLEVPEWVKQGRNRDTKSNLSDIKITLPPVI